MEENWPKNIMNILKIGHSLHDVGVNNWILTKEQALKALEKFRDNNIPVLGGEVYEKKHGTIEPNYDSWYCDELPHEMKDDFVKRSNEKAKKYIEEYKLTNIFFVLVPEI